MDTKIVTKLEDKYNNKYPKQVVRYKSRGLPNYPKKMLETDVRDFITPNNYLIDDVVKSIECDNAILGYDERAFRIQKWVIDNIKYEHDITNVGFNEMWLFPFETLAIKKSDCEDGSHLIASMLIASGIPNWRVRCVAGLVKTNSATAPTGGHGYVAYCRECDDTWIVLDWCYYPDLSPICDRKSLKENELYLDVWFSFNNLYSWGRNSMSFEGRVNNA